MLAVGQMRGLEVFVENFLMLIAGLLGEIGLYNLIRDKFELFK